MSSERTNPLLPPAWRTAREQEDDLTVAMCIELNREDPGATVNEQQVRRTLGALRAEPHRGKAIVAEIHSEAVGYALLIPFWSNEYGGEICLIDELYVVPTHRSRGIATRLFHAIATDRSLWASRPVGMSLEVTPENARARVLYERLGFRSRNQVLLLRTRTGRGGSFTKANAFERPVRRGSRCCGDARCENRTT